MKTLPRPAGKNLAALAAVFAAAWLAVKYLLPLALPFLAGSAVALAAEPLVRPLSRRLPRGIATVIGVSLALAVLACLLVLLAALAVKELALLAGALPELTDAALSGLNALERFLLALAARAPESVRFLVSGAVTDLFSSGSAIVDRLVQQVPALASAILGHVPGSALALGTGILSAYMLSARLPGLRAWFRQRMRAPLARYLPAVKQLRAALGGWLKAQLRLAGTSFVIVAAGLLLLRVPYAPIWAAIIALVDAIPVLGTGTVLLPWSLICLLQGQGVQALGLAGICAVAMLTRSALEPRLVGRQLGLDPLLTLVALYAGYRIWGIGGMLLAPLLCVAATELVKARRSGFPDPE